MPALTYHVNANGYARVDKPVEVTLSPVQSVARVVELTASGEVIDAKVPFQFDADGTLTWLLCGITQVTATRHYRVEFGTPATPVESLVSVIDGVIDEEQESYQINTPQATWFYHKQGAGFSSLLDMDGLDWLSYRPGGGSAGEYRGIPNLGYPEGYCHPGKTVSTSKLLSSGPLKASIESQSNDGVMRCCWDIFPYYARLTLLQLRTPYWLLYEGTPGGNPGDVLDEAHGYCVRSDGTRTALAETWEGALPTPEWLYFGAGNVNRGLYLAHHEADSEIDSYWPMEHNMTVFGFGRLGMNKYMTRIPAHFTVGFVQDSQFEHAKTMIESAFNPLNVEVEKA